MNEVVDTDAGDDIAVAFADRRPEIDVMAVSDIAYGTCRRAALARNVLQPVKRADVSVAANTSFPSSR